MNSGQPISDADLHAYVDGQLSVGRMLEVEAHLKTHIEDARKVTAWSMQKNQLRMLFDPVQDEPMPERLEHVARARPIATAPSAVERSRRAESSYGESSPNRWYHRVAASVMIAVLGGAVGWFLRGSMPGEVTLSSKAPLVVEPQAPQAAASVLVSDFARRAAVAHAVYTPDQRRAVEVDAEHEDQLVTWLSKRMGTPMRAPHLQSLGYTLEGGRLLPGGTGPVAQFMYRDERGERMTLYVSDEVGKHASTLSPASDGATAFRFAREGLVDVFYWVDAPFGYALSAQTGRAELARVSAEVYRQLERK